MSSRVPVRGPARRAASPAGTGLQRRNLPLLLLQARESVMARFRPILNAHGITEQQWRIVRALVEHGALEPRQIGSLCRISSPSLAGVLARMAAVGLVDRRRRDDDQRRVQVSITRAGRQLAARMAPQVEQAYREIELRIGSAPVQAVYDALDRLLAELGSSDEPEAEP
jgi:homoprotocatechuate degradation regulator HpaR